MFPLDAPSSCCSFNAADQAVLIINSRPTLDRVFSQTMDIFDRAVLEASVLASSEAQTYAELIDLTEYVEGEIDQVSQDADQAGQLAAAATILAQQGKDAAKEANDAAIAASAQAQIAGDRAKTADDTANSASTKADMANTKSDAATAQIAALTAQLTALKNSINKACLNSLMLEAESGAGEVCNPTKPDSPSNGPSSGTIVASVISALAGVGLGVAAICFYQRRAHKNDEERLLTSVETSDVIRVENLKTPLMTESDKTAARGDI
jgi:hypothetical protein